MSATSTDRVWSDQECRVAFGALVPDAFYRCLAYCFLLLSVPVCPMLFQRGVLALVSIPVVVVVLVVVI
jgi:hypothetical protein